MESSTIDKAASFGETVSATGGNVEGGTGAEFVRVAFVHWSLSADPPTLLGAEGFFDRFVLTSRPCREPPEGVALQAARTRFMDLVRPRLLPSLEQAAYLADELPTVSDPVSVGKYLDCIDGLLAADGSGVTIEAVVDTHRLPRHVRSLVGRRIAERIAVARGGPGRTCAAPVYEDDPLDPEHYAGIVVEHWLSDDSLWAPTRESAEQYFGFFTATALTCRNPREGDEMDATFEALMRLVGPHLADDLERARSRVTMRLPWTTAAAGVEQELDQIEMLLETDGRGLTVPDIVDLDALPPSVGIAVRRRVAARRAEKARLEVRGGPVGALAPDG